MTKFLLYAIALTAFAATPAVLWASPTFGTSGPVVKCHPKVCSNHGSLPADLGKGNPCKAHPRSCR